MLLLENSSPGFGWRMEIWRCASFSRVFWRRCSVDCEWRIQTARGTRKRDGQNGFFADLSCWNHVVWRVEQPATTEGCWSDNKDCLLLAATFSQWWFQRIFILKLIARDSHFDYYFQLSWNDQLDLIESAVILGHHEVWGWISWFFLLGRSPSSPSPPSLPSWLCALPDAHAQGISPEKTSLPVLLFRQQALMPVAEPRKAEKAPTPAAPAPTPAAAPAAPTPAAPAPAAAPAAPAPAPFGFAAAPAPPFGFAAPSPVPQAQLVCARTVKDQKHDHALIGTCSGGRGCWGVVGFRDETVILGNTG